MYEGDGFFIDPEGDKGQLVPLLRLLHEPVLEARIHDSTLVVKFSSGSALVAKPDNHYESWSYTGPERTPTRLIALPGGDVAYWASPS